ncbi:hypothetical protein ACT80S_16525 [Ramlibacter sp. MAHUQ-53]|uniref:hypothetical protein n=1 Tax=unclassified Ramlibacter TaxID=2617605 RepID=UPI00362A0BCE
MDALADDTTAAEAARYALLRRLGPALKHDLVVNLQAVAMMTEVLGARLERAGSGGPAVLAELQQQVARIHRVTREAVASSLKVAAWLTPADEDEGIALQDGIEDGLALVRSHFGFRGIALHAQAEGARLEVSRPQLRLLLLAALVLLGDEAGGPCALNVRGAAEAGEGLLVLERGPVPAPVPVPADDPGYRALSPADLRALAAEAGVPLQAAPGRIALRLPRLVATSPLKIAPM